MTEIQIYNFRNVVYRSLTFEKGIHLFEGESGIGKSTILEAFQWVLYGGKNIYPFGYDKSKKELTKVILKNQDWEITRTKPPECITVELITGEKYVFDEAQKYIDRFFGSKTFWESSYYLKQDCRNLLLFGSKEEKNNIVKEIVFGSDSGDNTPDKYLEKSEKYLEELDKQIFAKQSLIDYLVRNSEKNKVDITDKEIQKLCKLYFKRDDIEEKLEKIKLKIMEQEENKKKKLRKVQISMELKDYPELTFDFVQKWKEWIACCQYLEKINITDIDEEVGDINQLKKEIYDLERRREIFFPNKDRLAKISKIEYNKDKIEEEINKLEKKKTDIIRYQNYLEKRASVIKVVDRIKEINKQIEEFETPLSQLGNIDNLDEIKEKLMEMKTNLMKCPRCNKKLILCDGKLKEGKGTPISKKKLEEHAKNYKKLQEYHSWKQSCESLRKMYSEMRLPIPVEEVTGNEEEINKSIRGLKNIEVVNFNQKDYETKKKILERAEFLEKLKTVIKKRDECYVQGMENLKVPKDINLYYQQYQSLKEEYKILDSSIIEEENSDLEEKRKRGEKLLDDLDRYEDYLDFEEEIAKLKKESDIIGKLLEKRESCLKLKKIIHEESNITFENLMISFNQILNDIVSEVFEDIHIEIGMFKKLKSKSEIKPQFNMKVILKGHEYDNLNFLSGGEKDRMSLALMVTLAKLGKGEIVMLDETMSSLDEDMRHQMLELIKKHLPDKTVLVVCHSTIQGYYDSVVKF
jgi:ABC-type transport system involved in cytochrome c biogenesis ATPase subunit